MPSEPTSTRPEPDIAIALSAHRRARSARVQHDSTEIDAAEIEDALGMVAMLLEDNRLYLPIFLRLEQELEAALARSDALARARAISRRVKRS